MPGGRLTHDDRRRIADWVAEGLAYAEIARRLGRPTSTISREVARNRVTDGYLADSAQRAAGRRAHRRRPALAGEPPVWPDGAVRDFVERFATLLAGMGLARMSARVFTCLLTTDSGSLTAAELVRRLQVSPASVSKAIAYLESLDLVRRERAAAGRRERYVIDDDVWNRAWRTDTGAHVELARAARHGIELFGPGSPAATRLDRMGRFFAWVGAQMGGTDLTEGLVNDARTVLAALLYAARPLTLDALAAALGWSRERTGQAVAAVERHPVIADPLAVQADDQGRYTVAERHDRLSGAQRVALRGALKVIDLT